LVPNQIVYFRIFILHNFENNNQDKFNFNIFSLMGDKFGKTVVK